MFPIRDSKTSGSFPFINLAIIAFNIYVFGLEILAPNSQLFVSQYALIPAQVTLFNPNTWKPFLTSMFLHAGFLHILSNMWFLWIFGDNVEAKIGHIKYFLFYIFCGVMASLAQYIFITDSVLPMIGASGAIAGVLGAYLKFFPKNSVDTLVPVFGLPLIIAIPASVMLIYWFFIQAFSGFASVVAATTSVGGIAYLAHAGGFATGYLSSPSFFWQKSR
ncbi:rhomboid family intramembrane serine protease [Candidatus Curtissbacteria bacterium]|nr:rhomboid family intramembrane serine protease [Candidatus Curtissbacteria bacterium]